MDKRSYKKYRRAGVTDEEIRLVDNALDKIDKSMKREKKKMAKANAEGYIFISIWELAEMEDNEKCEFDTTDPDFDLEADTIHNEDLEKLREHLSTLSEMDRDILLYSYSGIKNHREMLMNKYGLSSNKLQRRKKRLLKYMRELFGLLEDGSKPKEDDD